MSHPSDRSKVSASSVVRGLPEPQQRLSVEAFFEAFPWAPSAHVALAQWSSRSFFDQFVR